MIAGHRKTGMLENSIISARCFEPFTVTTRDGKPARIAIIDDQGNIIDTGDAVAREAWNVMVNVYKNYLIGQGHVRFFSGDGPLSPVLTKSQEP